MLVCVYLVPVFFASSEYITGQRQNLQAAMFAESLMERFRAEASLYRPPPETDFYSNLENIYKPGTDAFPYDYSRLSPFFSATSYDASKSYVVAYGEESDDISKATHSKTMIIHLEWKSLKKSGKPLQKNYTLVSRVARPAGFYPTLLESPLPASPTFVPSAPEPQEATSPSPNPFPTDSPSIGPSPTPSPSSGPNP